MSVRKGRVASTLRTRVGRVGDRVLQLAGQVLDPAQLQDVGLVRLDLGAYAVEQRRGLGGGVRQRAVAAELTPPVPAARPLDVVLGEYLDADDELRGETTSHARTGDVEAEQPAAEAPPGDAADARPERSQEGTPDEDAAAVGREAAAPDPPAQRATGARAAGERNEQAILDALKQLGETPQASLADHARVSHGSISSVCRRLADAGKIASRQVPSLSGGRARLLWRLADQKPKDTYTKGGVAGSGKRMGQRQREKREAREKDAAGDEPTLRERILTTLQEASPHGLSMAHICAAVPGQERQNEVEDKVRVMWQDNELVRRRDGTFAAGGSAWRPGEDRDEEDAAA